MYIVLLKGSAQEIFMPKQGITYKGKPIGASKGGSKKKTDEASGSRKWLWIPAVILIVCAVGLGIVWFMRNHGGMLPAAGGVSDAVRRLTGTFEGENDAASPGRALPSSIPADQDGRSGIAIKALADGERLFSMKRYSAARDKARIAIGKFKYPDPDWQRSVDLLNKASTEILSGNGNSPETFLYSVRSGDTFTKIGRKFGTTADAVRRINKISLARSDLKIGQELTIYSGKWRIKVSNARKKLYLYDGANLFKVYPIGVAMEFNSPQGLYTLESKQENPVWQYKGNSYRPGDPLNILGTRSLGCTDAAEYKVKPPFLIHGTNRAENVGRTIAGPGFVSMKNEDINELFSIVPDGIEVEVIR